MSDQQPRGVFDYRAQERLTAIGNWMKYNNRSIYGCTEAPDEFKVPANTLLTYNPVIKTVIYSSVGISYGKSDITGHGR